MTEDEPEAESLEPHVSPDEARAAAQGSQPEAISEELAGAPVVERFSNVEQRVIYVDEDKVELALADAVTKLARRREGWGPAGLFAGLLVSLLTANYKDVLGVDAQTVKGIVIAVTVGTGAWTLRTIYRAFRGRSKDKIVRETIERLRGQ